MLDPFTSLEQRPRGVQLHRCQVASAWTPALGAPDVHGRADTVEGAVGGYSPSHP